MRLVFSRKGFDSKYGGGVSPILPDGTMVSFPIPESGSGIKYSDLHSPRGSLLELMRELGLKRYLDNGKSHPLDATSEAHLDPDLCLDTRSRRPDWRPVFGQSGAAQSVLTNRGVSKGGLFLFYGTFRNTQSVGDSLQFAGKPFHAVFGYMLIDDVVHVNSSTKMPWCAEHPHLVNRNRMNNTLYVAAQSLEATCPGFPGSGVLRFDERRILSASTERMSKWQLPRFFHPEVSKKAMSNHRLHAWVLGDCAAFLQTKSPGQEYVVEATDEMWKWALQLLAI